MGCHRTLAEIVAWSGSTDEERDAILSVASDRRSNTRP
jgi:predicted Fe-S protein YdhL (DUF1289 family)